tara:strand:- start:87 stop:386 length:300 start_codon:yes stop_codon:yes gene_type:complete
MADVWVLISIKNLSSPREVDAVVLGNRKIITSQEGTKEMLENDFEGADIIWARDNSSEEPMPPEELFGFLNAIHKNYNGMGHIMSAEKARELVKKQGGI